VADRDFKQRYWGRLQQLQKEHIEARKAGDFVLARKKKEDIRKIAATPFDNYIRRVDTPSLNRSSSEEGSNTGEQTEDVGETNEGESQFGQPIDQRKQQAQRTAGQEQADVAQQKVLGEQPAISPAKEILPGGPAIEATKKPAIQPDVSTTKAQPTGALGGTVDKGKEVTKQAIDQAMKFAKKAVAQLAKRAVTAFFASPYGWIVMAIIVGLVLLVLIIVLLWSVVFGSHTKVSSTGSTITQATNPLSDKEWIQRLLLFSKDDSATKALSDTALSGLETELGEIKKLGQYADKVAQIDSILEEITSYRTSRTEEAGKKLIGDIKALVVSLLSVPVMPTSIKTECNSEFCLKPSIGGSIHFGSPLNPCSADVKNGKNCPKPPHGSARTYIQFVQNTCDAVDLSAGSGTPVNAIFGGEVIDDRAKSGLQIKNGIYTAVYAHLEQTVKKGDQVEAGKPIGKISSVGHVHFELMGSGQCVVVTRSEYETGKAAGNTEQSILWGKMKAVMRIP
jgi:hypothetical protein